jgi:hypothetical protein
LLEAWLLLKGRVTLKRKRSRKPRAAANRKVRTSHKEALPAQGQPWREQTFSIKQFPRCAAYLKAMRVRLDDPEMHDYWCAVVLSDAFSDARLAALGTVNFDTMPGRQLLTAFETILSESAAKKKSGRKLKPVAEVEKIKGAASEAEIIAAMTPKGGWKAVTLASWGIAWPPPQGWRRKLVDNFEARAG